MMPSVSPWNKADTNASVLLVGRECTVKKISVINSSPYLLIHLKMHLWSITTYICSGIFIIDDCAERPCLLGAACTDLVNDFKCACPSGFTGKRCETKIDLCADSPCENGICVDKLFSRQCVCHPGWTGRFCSPLLFLFSVCCVLFYM